MSARREKEETVLKTVKVKAGREEVAPCLKIPGGRASHSVSI